MKRNERSFYVLLSAFLVFAFACVTVNIYFPAEEVKSVAGDIVKDVRGNKEGNKEAPSKDGKSSQLGTILLAFLGSNAWAEEATAVSNPTIRALKAQLKANYQRMKPYYQKGMVKEGNNGYVSATNTGGLNLREKRDLNSLVEAENQYRKQLYAEVARALKIDPSQINKIAEIFAKDWQKSVR
jgi:uncharacterized protein YdbL (DUF1318 family)